MFVVVVGGDNIEKINCNLCKKGFCVIKHISGRKSNHKCVEIPKNADLVLVFIDYVNHGLCEHIKRESKKLGIKTVYSKRAWSCVENLLLQ
ncbi:DUF2325 domain-containing protein [Clostridium sp. DJ247]|uniref:DUF2325 domain-containing protein n=1 Tax=Clostridium sp. DJ247 TaxID=2726188 RepID=UPI001627A84A|nr:DUF2325 domain-containing protein [Clostridium sp. DJ247]MBC2580016.1 DUF2325 domain-containing protein [Clostridium sp. DJ247]